MYPQLSRADRWELPHRTSAGTHLADKEASASKGVDFDLDLIVPVLNEEERLPATLAQIWPHLINRPWSTRLIVVDNGSVDATTEVVDRAKFVRSPGGSHRSPDPGKGAAVKAGMAYSSGRWVGYCDADLSTPAETIDEAMHQLQRGFDIVIASRRCTGGRYVVEQPLTRRAASWAFRFATAPFTGPITDTQCGLKLFDGPLARQLFAKCEFLRGSPSTSSS